MRFLVHFPFIQRVIYGSLPSIRIICAEALSRKTAAGVTALLWGLCSADCIPSSFLSEETKAPEPGLLLLLLLLLLQRALGHLHSAAFLGRLRKPAKFRLERGPSYP